MTILKIGAPSLNAGDAKKFLPELKALKYPIKAKVKNLMPRDVSFPEVRSLFLKHVANRDGRAEKEVSINSFSEFYRLISSVEQVSELNDFELAMEIEVPELKKSKPVEKTPEVEKEAETKAKAQPKKTTAARKSTTSTKSSDEEK